MDCELDKIFPHIKAKSFTAKDAKDAKVIQQSRAPDQETSTKIIEFDNDISGHVFSSDIAGR